MQKWKITKIVDSTECDSLEIIEEFEKYGKKTTKKCNAGDKPAKCVKAKCPLRINSRRHSYAFLAEQNEIAVQLGYKDAESAMPGLYNTGWTVAEIAKEFGVTWQAIHIRLQTMGVKLRPRGGANRPKVIITKEMYGEIMNSGENNNVLSRRCGISPPTVAKIKNGYTPDIRG